MESRHDSENAERILYNMRPKELVSAGVTPELLALHLHRRQGSESSLCPKSRVWGLLMYGLVKTQAGDPKCSQSIADLSLCSGLRWSWGQNVAQGQRGWPGICYLQGNMRLSLLCQLLGCPVQSMLDGENPTELLLNVPAALPFLSPAVPRVCCPQQLPPFPEPPPLALCPSPGGSDQEGLPAGRSGV